MKTFMRCKAEICGAAVVGLLAMGDVVHAQSVTRFTEQGGAAIFENICQGCHMPDGAGAEGAGRYPALAHDLNLSGRVYPLVIVVNGQRAMPAFGDLLSDRQIADVVNYIRSHFGNDYTDEVTTSEVGAVRPRRTRADGSIRELPGGERSVVTPKEP
jgi:mono/diheme cytochrome c family protein